MKHPLVKQKQAPLTLPHAYRSWAHAAAASGVLMQVHFAKELGKSAETPLYLAEVLARVTFEVCLGLHFDQHDTRMDILVRNQIAEHFGPDMLETVHQQCAEWQVSLYPAERAASELHTASCEP